MARILVVDDDAEQLALRRLILAKHGHETASAATRGDAIAACGAFDPEIVLMDLRLPSAEEGRTLIREIRQTNPDARVVVLTGYAGDIEGRPERTMVNEVLTKPAKMEKLLACLSRLAVVALLMAGFVPLRAGQPVRFNVADARSEVVASLGLSAPGADWGMKGKEGVLARILVDGKPRGHAWVFGEAAGDPVRVILGRLPAGEHRLEVEAEKSESAALAMQLDKAEVVEIRTGDPQYQRIAHAPVILARADTMGRFSDVPMIAYVEKRGGALRYSVIFSNEDGGTSTRDLMARWGRTADIEFVYQVDPSTGTTLIQAKGHKEIPYAGTYDGSHPTLEVMTTNNMVAPGDAAGKIDFRLLPESIELTGSREVLMDRHAWTYAVSSKELMREDKIRPFGEVREETISDPRNYLVAELNMAPVSAGVQVVVKLKGGKVRYASARGMVENYVTREGWLRMAVELPPGTRLADIGELLLDCVVTPDVKEREGAREGSCGLAGPGSVMLQKPGFGPGERRRVRASVERWRAGTMAELEFMP